MFVIVTFLCLHNFYFAVKNIEVNIKEQNNPQNGGSLGLITMIIDFTGQETILLISLAQIPERKPQGPTRAAVLSGAANVAIFVSAPQFYCFAINAPLRFCLNSFVLILIFRSFWRQLIFVYLINIVWRIYSAKKLRNSLPSRFFLQSRSRVSPAVLQRNPQPEVVSMRRITSKERTATNEMPMSKIATPANNTPPRAPQEQKYAYFPRLYKR